MSSEQPNSTPGIRPGQPKAIRRGCTCRPDQKPHLYRDGWGWEVAKDCPLHKDWEELGE